MYLHAYIQVSVFAYLLLGILEIVHMMYIHGHTCKKVQMHMDTHF